MEKTISHKIENIEEKVKIAEEALHEELIEHGGSTLKAGRLFYELAYYQYAATDYKSAKFNINKALELCRPVLTDENEDVIDMHYLFVRVLSSTKIEGDTEKIFKYSKKVLSLREQFDSKKPLQRSLESTMLSEVSKYRIIESTLIYFDTAITAKSKGDFETSSKYFAKTLFLRKSKFGDESQSIPIVAAQYAESLRLLGRLSDAKIVYDETFPIQEKYNGRLSLSTADYLRSIAFVEFELDNLSIAQGLYLEAVNITRSILGESHQNTASILNDLALVYREKAEFSKAISYHEAAIASQTKATNDSHPDTLAYKHNLTITKRRKNYIDKENIQTLFGDTFDFLRDKTVDPKNPYLLRYTINDVIAMADTFNQGGYPEQSLELFDICIGIKSLSGDKGKVMLPILSAQDIKQLDQTKLSCMFSYATKLTSQGNHADARNIYQLCLSSSKDVLKPNSLLFDSVYLSAAENLLMLAHYEDSYEMITEALKSRIDKYGMDHILVAEAVYVLAVWNLAKAKYEDAYRLCNQAINILSVTIALYPDTLYQAKNPTTLCYVRLLIASVKIQYERGNYVSAQSALAQLEAVCDKAYSGDHPFRVETFLYRGLMEQIYGNFYDAFNYLENSLSIAKVCCIRNHSKIAEVLNALGVLAVVRNEWTNARILLDESSATMRRFYPASHPTIINTIIWRCKLSICLGHSNDAYEMVQKPLALSKSLFNGNHPLIASCMVCMAEALNELRNPIPGKPIIEDCISIIDELIKSNHLHQMHILLVEAKYHRALNLFLLGDLSKALLLFEDHIQYMQKFINEYRLEYHYYHVKSKQNLAQLYLLLGRISEAESILISISPQISNIFGTNSIPHAEVLRLLGEVCKHQGKYKDAKNYYSKAIPILQKLCGHEHPKLAEIYHNASDNLRIPGRYDDAFLFCSKAFFIRQQVYGENNCHVAMTAILKSKLLSEMNQVSKEDKSLQKSLTVIKDKLGGDSIYFAIAIYEVAESLRLQKQYNISIRALKQSINLIRQLTESIDVSLFLAIMTNSIAFNLYNISKPYEALVLFKNDVLPCYEKVYGKEHPFTVNVRSRIGLCLNTIKPGVGQAMVDASLDFFDTYYQYQFSYDHPWINDLGGYDGSYSGSDDETSSQGSTSSYDSYISSSRASTTKSTRRLRTASTSIRDLGGSVRRSSRVEDEQQKALAFEGEISQKIESSKMTIRTFSPEDSQGISQDFFDEFMSLENDAIIKNEDIQSINEEYEKTIVPTEDKVTPKAMRKLKALEAADFLYARAIEQRNAGYYTKSLTLFEECLLAREANAPMQEIVSETMLTLADNYRMVSQHTKAIEKYQKALDLRILYDGRKSCKVAEVLIGLGRNYLEQGLYHQAEEIFAEVCTTYQELLDEFDPVYGMSLYHRGLNLIYCGLYSSAKTILDQSYVIINRAYGMKQIEISYCIFAQAELQRYQCRFTDAKALYEKCLSIRHQHIPYATHPCYSECNFYIAICLLHQGAVNEALKVFANVQEQRLQFFGDNSNTVGVQSRYILDGLYYQALSFYFVGRYHDSLALYKRVLSGYESIMPSHSEYICQTNIEIAKISILFGYYDDAKINANLCEELLQKLSKTSHLELPLYPELLFVRGRIEQELGSYEKARKYYIEALEAFQKLYSPFASNTDVNIDVGISCFPHITVLVIQQALCNLLVDEGQIDKACGYIIRYMKNIGTILGTEHYHYLSALRLYGNIMRLQGLYHDAEAIYQSVTKAFTLYHQNAHNSIMSFSKSSPRSGAIIIPFNFTGLDQESFHLSPDETSYDSLLCEYEKILLSLDMKLCDEAELERSSLQNKTHSAISALNHSVQDISILDPSIDMTTAPHLVHNISIHKIHESSIKELSTLNLSTGTSRSPKSGPKNRRISTKPMQVQRDENDVPIFDNSMFVNTIHKLETLISAFVSSVCNPKHPIILMIKGEIGIIKKLEYEAKQYYVMFLSPHDRQLFKLSQEKMTSTMTKASSNASIIAHPSSVPGIAEINHAISSLEAIPSFHSRHKYIQRLRHNIEIQLVQPSMDNLVAVEEIWAEAETMRNRGAFYLADIKYDEALVLLIDILSPISASMHNMVGDIFYSKGECCRMLGYFDLSKAYYAQCICVYRRATGGNENLDTMKGCHGLAELLRLQGLYEDSLALHQQILVSRMKLLNNVEDIILPDSLVSISHCLYELGRYKEAKQMADKAVLLLQSTTPGRSAGNRENTHDSKTINRSSPSKSSDMTRVYLANAYVVLGRIECILGNYNPSFDYYDKAYDARIQLHSESHPLIAEILFLKAENRYLCGHYRSAKESICQALHMFIEYYGDKTNHHNLLNRIHDGSIRSLLEVLDIAGSTSFSGNISSSSDYLSNHDSIFHDFDGIHSLLDKLILPAVSDDNMMNSEGRISPRQSPTSKFTDRGEPSTPQTSKDQNRSEGFYFIYKDEEICNHPKIAETLRLFGDIHMICGEYLEAKYLLQSAANMFRVLHGNSLVNRAISSYSTKTLHSIACLIEYLGNYEESYRVHSLVLQQRSRICPSDHNDVMESLVSLAKVSYLSNKFSQAKDHISIAYKICHKIFPHHTYPDNHPKTAEVLLYQTIFSIASGEYMSMEDTLGKCLNILKSFYQNVHPLISLALSAAGIQQYFLGLYTQANNYLEQSISMRQLLSNNNEFHSDIFNALRKNLTNMPMEARGRNETHSDAFNVNPKPLNLMLDPMITNIIGKSSIGLINYALGRYLEVEKQLLAIFDMSTLSILEKNHQKDYINVLANYISVSEIFATLGKYHQAKTILSKAQKIASQVFDTNHLLISRILEGMADVKVYEGLYQDAEMLYEQVLKIRKSLFNEKHVFVCDIYTKLGQVYFIQGSIEKSKERFDLSLTLYTQIYTFTSNQGQHPHMCVILDGIGRIYAFQGKFIEARSHYERSMTIKRNILGNDHVLIADSQYYIALIHGTCGKYEHCIGLVQRSYEIYRISYGSIHPIIGRCLHSMGYISLLQGNYDMARKWLFEGYRIKMLCYGGKEELANHPDLAESLFGLAEFYRHLGYYDTFKTNEMHSQLSTMIEEPSVNFVSKDIHQNMQNDLSKTLTLTQSLSSDTLIFSSTIKSDISEQNLIENDKLQGLEEGKVPALKLYEKSLAYRLIYFPRDHPLILECERGIGDCLHHIGKYKASHALFVNVLSNRLKIFGDTHPETMEAMICLADILKSLSRLFPPDSISHTKSNDLGQMISTLSNENVGVEIILQNMGIHDLSEHNVIYEHISHVLQSNPQCNAMLNHPTEKISSPNIALNPVIAPTTMKDAKKHPSLGKKSISSSNSLLPYQRGHMGHLSTQNSPEKGNSPYKQLSSHQSLINMNQEPSNGSLSISKPANKLARYSSLNNDLSSQSIPSKGKKSGSIGKLQSKMQYDSNKWLCDKSIAILKKVFGDGHPLLCHALFIKAEIYRQRRQPEHSLPIYEQCLNMYRQLYRGDNHPYIGLVYTSLGELYRTENNLPLALANYEKAMAIYKVFYKNLYQPLEIDQSDVSTNNANIVAIHHPYVADVESDIAIMLYSQGKYNEALPLFQSSLTIREKMLGKYHPAVAQSLNNYAGLLHTLGKYHEALPMYKRSLDIKIRMYCSKYHSDVASSMNNLGLLLKSQKQYDEAEYYYNAALEIQKKLYGEDMRHSHIASTLNNKASLYVAQDRKLEAKQLYFQVIELKRYLYGEDDPAVASSLNNLGGLLFNMGEVNEAKILYEESLRIRKLKFGKDHISVAESLNNIGLLLFSKGNLKEALEMYEEALRIKVSIYGDNHASVASSMHNLAGLLHKLRRLEEAYEWYNKAYQTRKVIFGMDHHDTKTSEENMRAIEIDMRKLDNRKRQESQTTLHSLPTY